jgi:hypothetical protein
VSYNAFVSLRLYLVSCEFLVAGADYASLREKLRTLGAVEVLSHQWALRSSYTAVQLKDILRAFMDDRDRITVTEVGHERASRRAKTDLCEL